MVQHTEKANTENKERIAIYVAEMEKTGRVGPIELALFEGLLTEATSRVEDDIMIMKIAAALAHLLDSIKTSVDQHESVYKSIQDIIEERAKKQEDKEGKLEIDDEKGFDLMLKRMVSRGVVS